MALTSDADYERCNDPECQYKSVAPVYFANSINGKHRDHRLVLITGLASSRQRRLFGLEIRKASISHCLADAEAKVGNIAVDRVELHSVEFFGDFTS